MEQRDRDLLIRMDERIDTIKQNQSEHKTALFDIKAELITVGTRLTKLEEQRKPLIQKLFTFILAIFSKGGSV